MRSRKSKTKNRLAIFLYPIVFLALTSISYAHTLCEQYNKILILPTGDIIWVYPETEVIYKQDSLGLVAFKAAGYESKENSMTHQWELQQGWMVAEPDGGLNVKQDINNTPRLNYNIQIVKGGTHYLWIKGKGPHGSSDSINYGIDGERLGTITFKDRLWSNYTQYTKTRATLDLSPGDYVFTLWMREDGTKIQEVRISNSEVYTP